MKYKYIDMEKWPRANAFEHFTTNSVMTYAVNDDVDITGIFDFLKNNDLKFYPTMCWAVMKLVNKHQEFRLSYDYNGKLGYFEEVSPCYTILHKETETISLLSTRYSDNLKEYHDAQEADMKEFANASEIRPREIPVDVVNISSLPWLSFKSIQYNVYHGDTYFLPIITWGKFYEKEGRTLMPLSFQIHHAAADGFHVVRFFKELEELVNNLEKYL